MDHDRSKHTVQGTSSTARSGVGQLSHSWPSSTEAGPSRQIESSQIHSSGLQDQLESQAEHVSPWWTGAKQPTSEHANGSRRRRRTVPYKLRTVLRQSKGSVSGVCQCVEFFPFVGPKRPKKTKEWRTWDKWENSAVMCGEEKVIIGRCVDDEGGACWVPIWQINIRRKPGAEPEDLYHVTWTIDPFTLHPIVIAGGKLGLIYVLDPVGKKLVRILRGHGDHVQALAVCPTMPHILASGSRDHTIRIWNLYGHEIDLAPGELPHQNYPMGDADEGNHVVAILCGNWPGGHRDDVCAVSWHPSHRAIATASRDHSFKIWALPVLPPPRVPKPERNYRPILVPWPLFSSNRISDRPVDSIQWLNDDVIVARTLSSVVTFQWLSYRRYFERGTWAPLGDCVTPVPDPAHWHDINDSRSIMIFLTYDVSGFHTYHRIGFHAAFTPTPDEAQAHLENPNLVQGFLVAIPQPGVLPEIMLFAPTLAPPDAIPELNDKLRMDMQDFSDHEGSDDDDSDDGSDADDGGVFGLGIGGLSGSGAVNMSVHARTQTGASLAKLGAARVNSGDVAVPNAAVIADVDGETETDTDSDYGLDSVLGQSDIDRGQAPSSPSNARDQRPRSPSSSSDSNRSDTPPSPAQCEWTLKAHVWPKIVKKHKTSYTLPTAEENNSVVMCCAISPRGAKWVLGVGQGESLFIWRLKDT